MSDERWNEIEEFLNLRDVTLWTYSDCDQLPDDVIDEVKEKFNACLRVLIEQEIEIATLKGKGKEETPFETKNPVEEAYL